MLAVAGSAVYLIGLAAHLLIGERRYARTKLRHMSVAAAIIDDPRAESDALDDLVAPLAPQRWADPTPAPG